MVESKLLKNGILVQRVEIIGGGGVCFNVYEPIPRSSYGHAVVTSHQDRWFGKLTARPAPEAILKLPVGPERWRRLDEFRERNRQEAKHYAIIAFGPEAVGKVE